MSDSSPVKKAYSYIERGFPNGEIRVPRRGSELFAHEVNRIIEEKLTFDIHDARLTHREIWESIKELLVEIKREEVNEGLSEDIETLFDRRKGDVLSELFGKELKEYTLTFPLNLGVLEPLVDELPVLNREFKPVPQNEWIEEYFDVAKAEDDGFLRNFLDVSPNDFLSETFSYYKIRYNARSEGYALYRIQDLANIALGKLNHCIFRHSREIPRPRNETALPHETWAALKEPAVYLVFQEGEYLFPRPMDYGYRRGAKTSHRHQQYIERFYDLPTLSEDDDVDTDLINALLAFQDGMTESLRRKSFFGFWRGIEILSQVGRPKSEIKNRSRFGREYMWGENAVLPIFEKTHEELDDIRNKLAHDGVHVFVGDDHRNYTKLLLDGMIELYYEERDNFDQDGFGTFLEYGVEYKENTDKIARVLEFASR
ncbi:hypothetical protein ACFQE1_00430 [Halobium palmae]|uniref:Apea-like HEPN domain-containing protein n=1 Tax=Halobium palmae TaxID=1776492 RepID=A0ABD5RUT6_9EURY